MCPQAHLQLGCVQMRVPRTDRSMIVTEDAHEIDRQVAYVAHACVDVRPGDGAGRRGLEVGEIGFFAGAGMRFWRVQSGSSGHGSLDASEGRGTAVE
jgi:hypothetical protein